MTTLKAFHGDEAVKEKYLTRVRAHRAADEIIKGKYWTGHKGCAVGCTIHGDSHAAYEAELGIPRIIARLEDGIFEGLPDDRSLDWPTQFLDAIPVGADLSMVWPRFALWLLLDADNGVMRCATNNRTKTSIKKVGALYKSWCDGGKPAAKEWSAAATYAAAAATYAAATYAADAYADAAAYAAAAADAADDAAAYAAHAATYAAAAATDATDAADAAATYATYATYAAARYKQRTLQADQLIELLSSSPVNKTP